MLLNEPSGTKLLISDRKQGSMMTFKGLPQQVFCSKVPLTLNRITLLTHEYLGDTDHANCSRHTPSSGISGFQGRF